MALLGLHTELLHNIVARLSPNWQWGTHWADTRRKRGVRANIAWFMRLRLVNKFFDILVIDHIQRAIQAGRLSLDTGLPLRYDLLTASTLAMGERLLGHRVHTAFSRLGGRSSRKNPVRDTLFIRTLVLGVMNFVEFANRRSPVTIDYDQVQITYADASIAAFVNVGGKVISSENSSGTTPRPPLSMARGLAHHS
ncbi:hypothetical protein BJX66DRAFT_332287 [Aspergillus keveii]|uniref:Uncharacterized protein n=1 Tax=Aspergillus keveii TaxID=714993 RepID=A0ABR4GM36_9EURO